MLKSLTHSRTQKAVRARANWHALSLRITSKQNSSSISPHPRKLEPHEVTFYGNTPTEYSKRTLCCPQRPPSRSLSAVVVVPGNGVAVVVRCGCLAWTGCDQVWCPLRDSEGGPKLPSNLTSNGEEASFFEAVPPWRPMLHTHCTCKEERRETPIWQGWRASIFAGNTSLASCPIWFRRLGCPFP